MKSKNKALLTVFVLGAVSLNILAAIVMKLLANHVDITSFFLLVGIAFVVILNGLRLVVWMFANRYFPLSTMYPLTSIFYPLMLGVSYLFSEKITFLQIIGTAFITFGVFWLSWKVKIDAP